MHTRALYNKRISLLMMLVLCTGHLSAIEPCVPRHAYVQIVTRQKQPVQTHQTQEAPSFIKDRENKTTKILIFGGLGIISVFVLYKSIRYFCKPAVRQDPPSYEQSQLED